MAKGSISKGVIKDILIVGIGVLAIWIGLQVAFGTQNPFYVVSSGSMIPELQVYDVLVVSGHVPFEEIKVGDIIVFDRPSGHDRVIVHRVASIIDEDPKTIRTKGDANPASIPGTDFPITETEYIGKVAYTIPQVGFVTQVLRPPINYVIIVIVIGAMIAKQMLKKKKEKDLLNEDPFKVKENQDVNMPNDMPELDKLENDDVYSNIKNDDIQETKSKLNTDDDKQEKKKDE